MENLKSIYFKDSKDFMKCLILREHEYYIYKFQYLLRKEEISKHFWTRFFYRRRKNKLGRRLGFYIPAGVFGDGLHIWHYGEIVINKGAKVGCNCVMHGDNCIGNNGKNNNCPTIGNNVDIGIGAKILGGIFIEDDVKVGAGAIVVRDCLKKGATLVGIPAREI